MLTYELNKQPGIPLYEHLYRCIREDILSGHLTPGSKLPSKRALAAHLKVSKITVEGAYNQLLGEGYIRSAQRAGYFVESLQQTIRPVQAKMPVPITEEPDLSGTPQFPFTVWSRLQREVMLDLGQGLLQPMPNIGILALRQAIADHLMAFRGLAVDPENILVGAGTDFLYNLLIQLLGRNLGYAVEEPGYGKIRKIYDAGGVRCVSASMDEKGVNPQDLKGAQVLHISPAHHFPTGIVTPMDRRLALLEWAGEDKWIIEDDYDSEFRFTARPMAAMASLDRRGRVIYMNTFSKSLAPSIRISYMVLPRQLMARFQEKLGFYSCTVPSFEQHTLARFLQEGHFDKHINRSRRFYKARRDQVLALIGNQGTILEENAGLHFLLKLDTQLSDRALEEKCRSFGLPLRALSSYYHQPSAMQDTHSLVVSYAGLSDNDLNKLQTLLNEL